MPAQIEALERAAQSVESAIPIPGMLSYSDDLEPTNAPPSFLQNAASRVKELGDHLPPLHLDLGRLSFVAQEAVRDQLPKIRRIAAPITLGVAGIALSAMLASADITPSSTDRAHAAEFLQTPSTIIYVAPDRDCDGNSPCTADPQWAADHVTTDGVIKFQGDAEYSNTHQIVYTDPLTSTRVFTTEQIIFFPHNTKPTLQGGFPPGNWDNPDPKNHPSVLSTHENGRVITLIGSNQPQDLPPQFWGSQALITGFTFRDNAPVPDSGNMQGGAILSINSAPRIEDNVFETNQAERGGAVTIKGSSWGASAAVIYRNVFKGNSAIGENGRGGGVYITGAPLFDWPPVYVASNCFSEDSASESGGAFLNNGGYVPFIGNTIHYAQAGDHGAVVGLGGQLETESNLLVSNYFAFLNRGGNWYVRSDFFWGNTENITKTGYADLPTIVEGAPITEDLDPLLKPDGCHIQDNSPAIGAGSHDPLLAPGIVWNLDIDKQTRAGQTAGDDEIVPPTPTNTATATETSTSTSTATATETPQPTEQPTEPPTATATATATNTATATETSTATATETATPTETATGTPPTPTDTATATSTATPENTATATLTPPPTDTPVPVQELQAFFPTGEQLNMQEGAQVPEAVDVVLNRPGTEEVAINWILEPTDVYYSGIPGIHVIPDGGTIFFSPGKTLGRLSLSSPNVSGVGVEPLSRTLTLKLQPRSGAIIQDSIDMARQREVVVWERDKFILLPIISR
jgi:hypothetical protein